MIHIRNIPNEVTEAEIVHLGIPFGKVTNVLVLKGKNQVGERGQLFESSGRLGLEIRAVLACRMTRLLACRMTRL